MFATFKMDLPNLSGGVWEEYYNKGLKVYSAHKQKIKASLDKYLSIDGELKASEIEKDWFPSFKADVFLSHSHKDEKDVITLAGLLNDMGLTAFIDSCVWGYADDLLRQIDNEYCVSKMHSDGSVDTYNYQRRNQSTAHVHMMLNGALMKMMDNTECLIVLNTPNSLKAKDILNGTTNSGWIYSELLMSKFLRKNCPIRKSVNFAINESIRHDGLSIAYDADITHLIVMSINDIISATENGEHSGLEVLDRLYFAKGLYEKK
mgnify:CR=1 FL=1